MDLNAFEKLVNEGIDMIEEDIRNSMNNVSIIIEDFPTPEQMQKMRIKHGQLLLGLYEGIPPMKRMHYSGVLPDKITIFKTPIEMIARSDEHLKQLVADTIWHEVAHHHGMNETEVRRAEEIRRRMKYENPANN